MAWYGMVWYEMAAVCMDCSCIHGAATEPVTKPKTPKYTLLDNLWYSVVREHRQLCDVHKLSQRRHHGGTQLRALVELHHSGAIAWCAGW